MDPGHHRDAAVTRCAGSQVSCARRPGCRTTEDIADPWPDPMATDASDDSPSAIALDWVIVQRQGFVVA